MARQLGTTDGMARLGNSGRRGTTWRYVVACGLLGLAASAWAQEPGNAGRGLAYAQQVCSACHAVLPIELVSPKPESPTFSAVANTPGMTGTALAVWLQTPHKSMPNFVLPLEDRNNVIAYIVSLREPTAK